MINGIHDPRYRQVTASAGYRLLIRVRARIYREHGLCDAFALIDTLADAMRKGIARTSTPNAR